MSEKQIKFEFHCDRCLHKKVCSIRDAVEDAVEDAISTHSSKLPNALSVIFKCNEYREDIVMRTSVLDLSLPS